MYNKLAKGPAAVPRGLPGSPDPQRWWSLAQGISCVSWGEFTYHSQGHGSQQWLQASDSFSSVPLSTAAATTTTLFSCQFGHYSLQIVSHSFHTFVPNTIHAETSKISGLLLRFSHCCFPYIILNPEAATVRSIFLQANLPRHRPRSAWTYSLKPRWMTFHGQSKPWTLFIFDLNTILNRPAWCKEGRQQRSAASASLSVSSCNTMRNFLP